jgi:outer membrane protein insertion porin family/translocation and assembly module TamA
LRLAASARLSWEHRNFLGGLRNFTATTRPGVTLFPTRIDDLQKPTRLLPENALTLRLQQPAFLEARTTAFIESAYNIYPLLYPLPEGADPEAENIIGYNELREAVGLNRVVWGRRVPLELSYNWQANFPFKYQGKLLDGLDTVIVSYPELITTLDLRDNPLSTKEGVFVTNSFQVANPLLGGMLTDIRVRPEARLFVPVDYAKRAILAARVTFGFLFPSNYGGTLDPSSPDYIGLQNNPSDPRVVNDQEKLLFRAFYSGGPDSNRGYPYRRVGPQGPIGFLQPTGENCSVRNPDGTPRELPNACIRPLGGFTLWEASLELRFTVADPWGVVAFVDASNVSNRVAHLDFDAPHISVGPGLRYASPVGPIRLDVGWRVPGLQIFKTDPTTIDVAELDQYADDSWYNAFNLNILIGEAF